MPLDASVAGIAARLPSVDWGPRLDPVALRAERRAVTRPTGPSVRRVSDRLVPGPPDAPPVPVRCYWPEDHANPPVADLPVVLFFHGGGFVLGDLDTADAIARRIAVDCDALVVSADYRLAPEHPFPAAPRDALAVYTWLLEAAPVIGGDPARVAVAGESSGANLAAVLCHAARDGGLPLPVFQMLWYPNTDTVDTPARRENAEAPVLSRAALHWLERQYTAGGTADAPESWAAPARAASFHGLPPALVTAGHYDPLRDDGKRYARLLRRDGVHTSRSRCAPPCRTASSASPRPSPPAGTPRALR